MATTTLRPMDLKPVEYPTRDGKPMAETDKHAELMIYVREALKIHFHNRPDVYVSGNNFVYWVEGDAKSRISPDVYVVFGTKQRLRDYYKCWEENGHLPSVVFEFTSRKTRREDTDTKLPLYEQVLKTPEYFLFDPTGDYLRPRLQGYRLVNGKYVRLALINDRLHSEQLGLILVQDGEWLRLYDPATGEYLPTNQEQADLVAEQTRRIEEQTRRAEAAEAEIARLQVEIEALNKNA